jgi:inosose dehydratase
MSTVSSRAVPEARRSARLRLGTCPEETQQQTERFLDQTDPRYVSLCLDTGHLAYRHADNAAIIRGYPDRIGYVHIKQMDPAVVAIAAAALRELGTDLFVVVEQDMYPVDFDRPKPIAERTYHYLRNVGIGDTGIGDTGIGEPGTGQPDRTGSEER